MLCKSCYSIGIKRFGGELGVCIQHKKRKCLTCGKYSDGKQLCADCEHASDELRWQKESSPLHVDPDHKYVEMEIRKERLRESKFHAFRAIEILFRAIVLGLEATRNESEKAADCNPEELKKAA